MSVNTAFLRTRVARRILGMFIACALLPVGVVAVAYEVIRGKAETHFDPELVEAFMTLATNPDLELGDHLRDRGRPGLAMTAGPIGRP